MNTERLGLKASEAAGNYLLESVHRVVYGRRNLKMAGKHLEGGGSLIVFTDHFAKLEIALYSRIIQEYLTSLDHVTGIASRRHFDPECGPMSRIQSMIKPRWEKIHGATILLAVQRRDYGYYNDHEQFNARMTLRAGRKLRKPRTIVFISPEGTRSTTNRLLRAEDGLGELLGLGGKNVLALPLAAIHKTILPGRRTTVIAGKLFSYQDLLDDQAMYMKHYEPIWRSMGLDDPKKMPDITLSDCAMTRLATTLPVQNQGVYTDLVAVRKQLILPGSRGFDFKTT